MSNDGVLILTSKTIHDLPRQVVEVFDCQIELAEKALEILSALIENSSSAPPELISTLNSLKETSTALDQAATRLSERLGLASAYVKLLSEVMETQQDVSQTPPPSNRLH